MRHWVYETLLRVLTLLGITLVTLTLLYTLVPPVSFVMIASLLQGDGIQRSWVPLSKISPNMRLAVIAAEDGRFCDHHGIDPHAIDASLEKHERGGNLNGASTITMQTAKNLFLWNGRSWVRKIMEAPLALWIDAAWTKPQILEVYLNVAQWGKGVFGVEQAARRNFGVSARHLTARQAALLAASLPNPENRRAAAPSAYHADLATRIEARMGQDPSVAACVAKRQSLLARIAKAL